MATATESGQQNFGTARAFAKGLTRKVYPLTSAQILLLFTTPITLVNAPGSGKTILPVFAKIDFSGGSVAYTNAGGAVTFAVGTRSYTVAEQFITTVTPNSTHQYTPFAAAQSTAANPPTDENAALTIGKATGNYAAGNGTATVTVYYAVEDTAPTDV